MSSPSNSPTTYFIIPTKTPTSPFNTMASSSLPPAPPPTPSNNHHSAPDATTISGFLRQLTPKLSLPPQLRRRQSPAPHTIPLPLKPSLLLESASMHGFFHLSGHDLPWELLASASEEARGVLGKRSGANHMVNVLGFKDDESDEESDDHEFFVFDVACLDSVSVPAKLAGAAGMMGRIGVEVVEMLMDASGLENPFKKEEKKGLRCLMWVSSSAITGDVEEQCAAWEKKYPYLVCLHYEMKSYTNFKLHLDDDLTEVTVPVQPDSILITIGDIAQVWSNGKFKKVIRKPIPSFSKETNSTEVTMSLLVTLPMDTIVSPLPRIGRACGDNDNNDDDGDDNKEEEETEKHKYKPFNMDEYASRVYYELLTLKDPLSEYLNV